MARIIIVAMVALVFPAILLVLMWRREFAYRRANPEWWAAWKGADRAQKRRVRQAVRRGSMLHNPDDARLLVGLSERADAMERRRPRRIREWFYAGGTLVGVVLAIVSRDPGLFARVAVPAVSLLVLTRFVIAPLRERRKHAVEVNRQVLGKQRRRDTADSS